ncbi:hypothetical protein SK128_026294 [Halocaridina rubra]|uniref:MICAL-like protein 1 n=1 Tax=Halocaridina rubra TaxID=373956 RepID=A0AAN8ZYP1_HALRR
MSNEIALSKPSVSDNFPEEDPRDLRPSHCHTLSEASKSPKATERHSRLDPLYFGICSLRVVKLKHFSQQSEEDTPLTAPPTRSITFTNDQKHDLNPCTQGMRPERAQGLDISQRDTISKTVLLRHRVPSPLSFKDNSALTSGEVPIDVVTAPPQSAVTRSAVSDTPSNSASNSAMFPNALEKRENNGVDVNTLSDNMDKNITSSNVQAYENILENIAFGSVLSSSLDNDNKKNELASTDPMDVNMTSCESQSLTNITSEVVCTSLGDSNNDIRESDSTDNEDKITPNVNQTYSEILENIAFGTLLSSTGDSDDKNNSQLGSTDQVDMSITPSDDQSCNDKLNLAFGDIHASSEDSSAVGLGRESNDKNNSELGSTNQVAMNITPSDNQSCDAKLNLAFGDFLASSEDSSAVELGSTESVVLRRHPECSQPEASRQDRHGVQFVDDIPFIDDEEEETGEDSEAQTVILRQNETVDPFVKSKRNAELHFPVLRKTVAKKIQSANNNQHQGEHVNASKSDEEPIVVPRKKKKRVRSQAWFCYRRHKLDSIAEKACEEAQGGSPSFEDEGRPLSMDEDTLQFLLHQLLTEKTAQEAAGIMSVERRGTKALELWAKKATDGYPGVSISNMTTAWRDGLAFCALIHHFKPDLIEYSSLKAENIYENNALAFRVAEQQLGIPALLDAEDMVDCDIPDRLSVLTYVSQFYQVFSNLGLTSPKRVVTKSSPPSTPAGGVNKTKASLTPPPPQPKTKTEIKTDKVLVGGRSRREVCVGCQNPVFLAERLLVGSPGQLMHRTCFRCARCNTQLTLASYYETEKGQFCCEMCPDEELQILPGDSNSIVSSNSPQLSRRTSTSGSDSEYESEDSDNESEEDRAEAEDKKTHPPNISPNPLKPRTVFLSKTLEGESTSSISNERKETLSEDVSQATAEVPSASFEAESKDKQDIGADNFVVDHSNDAKGFITDPPDDLNFNTGQGVSRDNANSEPDNQPSIVAQRLKMFREISSNSSNIVTLKNSEYNSADDDKSALSMQRTETNNDSHSDVAEKYVTTVEDQSNGANRYYDLNDYDLDKDENTKDLTVEKKLGDDSSKDNDDIEETNISPPVPSIVVSADKGKTEDTQEISEYNPFEDNDIHEGSKTEENSVDIDKSLGGSEAENSIASASQDSGVKVSLASQSSCQYPEDLNPFGSEEEEGEDESACGEVPAKKLIKANLNPFGSDDEEDDQVENNHDSTKIETKRLNPFWSDDEEPYEDSQTSPSKNKIKPPRPPPPTLARNCTHAQMYGKRNTSISPARKSPGKKFIAPSPPPERERSLTNTSPHPSPSSPSGSLALRRKARRAPAPPQAFTPRGDGASSSESAVDNMSIDSVSSSHLGVSQQPLQGKNNEEGQDEVMNWKMQKDMKNHSNKLNGTTEQLVPPPKPARALQATENFACSTAVIRRPSMSKSEAGEWQRKKGPAPPRPVPQKRSIKKMPMRLVQQELQDIEIQQTELERQGVLLETAIRNRTESTSNNPEDAANVNSGPSSIEVEDMIMQLFELVNEKNELFRRQTELMYLKREKRLEEEYVEIEYQIRCLMLKPPSEKTESDHAQEEDLIARLMKVVEQRDEIINCLELDRLREAQEDESIASHMMRYQEKHIDGISDGSTLERNPKKKKTLRLPRKKKKKEKKDKKGTKADADKDIDETEVKAEKKRKKKWLF